MPLRSLPDDLLLASFHFLDRSDLTICELVSRRWSGLVERNAVSLAIYRFERLSLHHDNPDTYKLHFAEGWNEEEWSLERWGCGADSDCRLKKYAGRIFKRVRAHHSMRAHAKGGFLSAILQRHADGNVDVPIPILVAKFQPLSEDGEMCNDEAGQALHRLFHLIASATNPSLAYVNHLHLDAGAFPLEIFTRLCRSLRCCELNVLLSDDSSGAWGLNKLSPANFLHQLADQALLPQASSTDGIRMEELHLVYPLEHVELYELPKLILNGRRYLNKFLVAWIEESSVELRDLEAVITAPPEELALMCPATSLCHIHGRHMVLSQSELTSRYEAEIAVTVRTDSERGDWRSVTMKFPNGVTLEGNCVGTEQGRGQDELHITGLKVKAPRLPEH